MRTKIDKRYLTLVNRENPLENHKPDGYEYDNIKIKLANHEVSSDDVIVEKGERTSIVETFIERKTHHAYKDMHSELSESGVNDRINEAGRTELKQALYRENAEKRFGHEYAENYVAMPHETEHGLGTAVDIGVFSKPLSNIKHPKLKALLQKLVKPRMYSIMHRIAVKHGFITRYPIKYKLTDERRKEIEEAKKGNNITLKSSGDEFRKLKVQYNYEPWHETYVGEENAEFITKNKLILEEYVKLVELYEAYADEFGNDEECPSLQEFYDMITIKSKFDDMTK